MGKELAAFLNNFVCQISYICSAVAKYWTKERINPICIFSLPNYQSLSDEWRMMI